MHQVSEQQEWEMQAKHQLAVKHSFYLKSKPLHSHGMVMFNLENTNLFGIIRELNRLHLKLKYWICFCGKLSPVVNHQQTRIQKNPELHSPNIRSTLKMAYECKK